MVKKKQTVEAKKFSEGLKGCIQSHTFEISNGLIHTC